MTKSRVGPTSLYPLNKHPPQPLLLPFSSKLKPKATKAMELHFQQNPPRKQQYQLPTASKTKSAKAKAKTTKFVGVRQRPSGRWVAEIKDTTQKIRMWLGTFETAEEAARAYDAAACLLRGANTRTNFSSSSAADADSPLASRVRNLLKLKKQSKNRASPKTNINPHPPGEKTTHHPTPVPPPPPLCINFNPCSSTSISAESKICSSSSSSNTSNTSADAPYHERNQQDGNLGEELDLVWPSLAPLLQEPSSWAFDCGELLLPPRVASEEMAELERMKVERQFSASLYAMNGVQEYLDMVQVDPLPLEALWDLPPPWHLSCRT
ncbi:hypothetical protein ZIOFF_005854 [Zingiber officinale]|uniref:AP2/ERF domain-containing protein n=2 Tax=Zingiber officinale TaxID=94328 RepID=A0A8J5M1X2_ZINOF|nr:hypothetical protein ZIOFF_005854 [Zingiber officinale]